MKPRQQAEESDMEKFASEFRDPGRCVSILQRATVHGFAAEDWDDAIKITPRDGRSGFICVDRDDVEKIIAMTGRQPWAVELAEVRRKEREEAAKRKVAFEAEHPFNVGCLVLVKLPWEADLVCQCRMYRLTKFEESRFGGEQTTNLLRPMMEYHEDKDWPEGYYLVKTGRPFDLPQKDAVSHPLCVNGVHFEGKGIWEPEWNYIWQFLLDSLRNYDIQSKKCRGCRGQICLQRPTDQFRCDPAWDPSR